MDIQELANRLKQGGSRTGPRMRRADAWSGALLDLFERIESWAKPATDARVFEIERTRKEAWEPFLGSYYAPILLITDVWAKRALNIPATIAVDPICSRAVYTGLGGALRTPGRVDIVGEASVTLLLSSTNLWYALPLRGDPEILTEHVFARILEDLLLS